MTGMLRIPRSRGAMSGLLLVLLGLWGALIPLVGPYFSFAYTPDSAWTMTAGRLWLEIVPGAAVLLGGIVLLVSAMRPMAMTGAALSAIGGAWFAVGAVLSPLWAGVLRWDPGSPVGGPYHQVFEQIGFFTGLGVAIVFVAALALGRLSLVGVHDARLGTGPGEPVVTKPAPATTRTGTRESGTAQPAGRSVVHSFGRWLAARS